MSRFTQNTKHKRILVSQNNKVEYIKIFNANVIIKDSDKIDVNRLLRYIVVGSNAVRVLMYKDSLYYMYKNRLFSNSYVLLSYSNDNFILHNIRNLLIEDILQNLLIYIRNSEVSLSITPNKKHDTLIIQKPSIISFDKKKILAAALALL